MRKIFVYNNNKELFLKRFFLTNIVFFAIKVLINMFYIRDILSADISIFYRIHSAIAIVSHTMIEIALILVSLYLIFKLFRKMPPLYVFIFVFILDIFISIIDVIILSIYGFHINSFIISEFLQPNFFETSGVSFFSFAFFILSITVFGSILYISLVQLMRRVKKPFSSPAKIIWKRFVLIILSVVIVEKIILSINLIYSPAYTSQLRKNIPVFYLSYIIRVHEILTEDFKMSIPDEKENYEHILDSSLDSGYPIEKDILIKNKYNVILLILESTRADYFNKENFPLVMKIIEDKGFTLVNNYSGSNSTHMGIFGILYSLNPHYSEEVKTKKTKSFPIDVFRKNGYDTLFYVSGDSSWHHMDYYLKQNFQKNKDYAAYSSKGFERDRKMVDDLLQEISSTKTNFLYGLFFDSTHYPYTFSNDYQINKPFLLKPLSTSDYMFLSKSRVELVNSYKNSLRYADSLIEKLLIELNRLGKDRNTIIVITSDHGEEFGDQENYFHANSLNNIQTKVPLSFIMPKKNSNLPNPEVVSSNMDIFPTLFDLMGVDFVDNFQGKSIFKRSNSSFVTVAYQNRRRPNKFAVIGNDLKCIIALDNSRVIESVHNAKDDTEVENRICSDHLKYFFNELMQFKKKPNN